MNRVTERKAKKDQNCEKRGNNLKSNLEFIKGEGHTPARTRAWCDVKREKRIYDIVWLDYSECNLRPRYT